MAQIKSQIKRIQTNELARQRNVAVRSHVATEVKKVKAAVAKGDGKAANEALKVAIKVIDTAVSKGVYTKNTAGRKKSSITKLVNSLSK